MDSKEYERLQARLTDLQNKKERQPSSGSNWRDGWKDAILAVKSLVHSEFKTNSVEHGHWIINGEWCTCSKCKQSLHYERSNGKSNLINALSMSVHYCPNCGTKMDEKATRETE